jgi:hypothetical protein
MRARQFDRYDYIGVGLIALLAVVWGLHFVLPAPPPEPELPGAPVNRPFPG